jgi:hypothetical protein
MMFSGLTLLCWLTVYGITFLSINWMFGFIAGSAICSVFAALAGLLPLAEVVKMLGAKVTS